MVNDPALIEENGLALEEAKESAIPATRKQKPYNQFRMM